MKLKVLAASLLLCNCTYFVAGNMEPYRPREDGKSGQQKIDPAVMEYKITLMGTGYDQIPKEKYSSYLLPDYDDIMREIASNFREIQVLGEPRNSRFALQHRKPKDSALVVPDKKVILEINESYSYPRYFLQTMFAVPTLTVIPLNFPRYFEMKLSILNTDGSIEKSATSNFKINHIWWAPLAFIYPFYNEKRAMETAVLNTAKGLIIEVEKNPVANSRKI